MNSCKIPSNCSSPILYYQGTFDPAHKGHLSALQSAMEATHATSAVIVVDDADNLHKPERSSWKTRKETAIRTFAHLENVCVSELPKEETKKALLKNKNVTILIGSDVWPVYSERKKIPFDTICINTRISNEDTYPKTLAGKNIIFITSPTKGCSSTKIRDYLKSHPELYEKAPIPEDSILDQLEPSTLNFILENRLYYLSRESYLKENLKKYISQHIFKDKKFEFTSLTNISASNAKLGGQSGDLTFLASCEEKKIFIKSYIRSSHLTDYKNEVEGINLLNSLSLSWAKAVTPVYYGEETPTYSHIGIAFLEQPNLAKVFKSINNEESQARFIDMCFYAGRALSELHHNRSHPIQLDSLQKESNLLNKRALARLKELPLEKQKEFESIFSASYEGFMRNPGMHTYAHGDANLSNFIVDMENATVYLLDLDRLSLKRSEDGNPLGFPAEDYHRFLTGISWLNEDGSIPSSVVTSAQEAFKKGYATFPSSITPEANRYFSNYWLIRNYKFQKQDPT